MHKKRGMRIKYIIFYKHILYFSSTQQILLSIATLLIHFYQFAIINDHNALSSAFSLRYSFPCDYAIISRSCHSFPSFFQRVGKVFEAAP